MQEEIQMIKEALEIAKIELKMMKVVHYWYWAIAVVLTIIVAFFIIASVAVSGMTPFYIFIIASVAYWNIKRHNNLVLEIEDLEYVLEELTKE